jgi:hypothetical protein
MENAEAPKRRGWPNWSTIRKVQIIGASVGALFTIGVTVYFDVSPEFLGFSSYLYFLTSAPLFLLVGKGCEWPTVVIECLVVIINLILGFLVGTFIGWLIQKFKAKN